MTRSEPIRTLIVDDEPLARAGFRVRLEKEPGIEIVGEAVDGPEAVELVERLEPDLVFLDIQMPGMTGFEVLERIGPDRVPIVVFVTAYDAYALEAFEAHAFDYLLKPLTRDRFREALARARRELERRDRLATHERILGLLETARAGAPSAGDPGVEPGGPPPPAVDPGGGRLTRFAVKVGSSYRIVDVDRIDWIGAAANYAELHVGERTYLVRTTMAELERRLDSERFTRIHRSTIVQLDRIVEIRPEWHGDYEVVLKGGDALRVGRSFRKKLLS